MGNNHHMRTICPICNGIKDNRATICQSCRCSSGLARLGTGKYPNHNKEGYVMVHQPEHHKANRWGFVNQATIVWEEYNQKLLPDGMHIHHIDSNRSNNDPANLMALTPSEHAKIHNSSSILKGKTWILIDGKRTWI